MNKMSEKIKILEPSRIVNDTNYYTKDDECVYDDEYMTTIPQHAAVNREVRKDEERYTFT